MGRRCVILAAALLVVLVTAETIEDAVYEREGFFILPGLLSRSAALAYGDQVRRHVATSGAYYQSMLGGKTGGGWYIFTP